MTTATLPARARTLDESAAIATSRADLGIAVLRVILGLVFAAHGAQKIFVFGFDGVAASFGQMGVPLAGLIGPAVALGELLGGIALMAGVLTRVVAPLLALIMIGATMLVHLPNGFFAPNGIEFTLTLFAGAVALALTGAGRYSLDRMIALKRGES